MEMIAHQAVRDAKPIGMFEGTAEKPEVTAALELRRKEPVAIDEATDDVLEGARPDETSNARHAVRIGRLQVRLLSPEPVWAPGVARTVTRLTPSPCSLVPSRLDCLRRHSRAMCPGLAKVVARTRTGSDH